MMLKTLLGAVLGMLLLRPIGKFIWELFVRDLLGLESMDVNLQLCRRDITNLWDRVHDLGEASRDVVDDLEWFTEQLKKQIADHSNSLYEHNRTLNKLEDRIEEVNSDLLVRITQLKSGGWSFHPNSIAVGIPGPNDDTDRPIWISPPKDPFTSGGSG